MTSLTHYRPQLQGVFNFKQVVINRTGPVGQATPDRECQRKPRVYKAASIEGHCNCNRLVTRTYRMKRVVVIGGGVSGIAATTALLSSGSFDVKLLEAKDRLGGRCNSTRVSGVSVELGASYFHGCKGNVMFEMAQEKGFAPSEPIPSPGEDSPLLLSDGTTVPREVFDYYSDVFYEVMDKLKEEQWKNNVGELDDYLTKEFFKEAKRVQELKGGVALHSLRDSYMYPVFHCLLTDAGTDEGARMCQGVGTSSVVDYEFPEGPQSNLFLEGFCYGDLVRELSKDLPEDTVRYGTEVHSIEWNVHSNRDIGMEHQNCPTVVHTSNGDFFADHVIITVSLGVLKAVTQPSQASASAFFTPPLPQDKLEAISAIGFGVLNKVILEFEEPILNETVHLLWRAEDIHNDPLVKQYPWLASLYVIQRVNNSCVYCVYFAGSDAQQVASLPEEEVAVVLLKALGEKFLQKTLPPLKHVICTNWDTDPCFLGSYSFSPPCSFTQHREILAQPVAGTAPLQLLFAGEATSARHFATTHGAYESGVREASRLIQHYRSINCSSIY